MYMSNIIYTYIIRGPERAQRGAEDQARDEAGEEGEGVEEAGRGPIIIMIDNNSTTNNSNTNTYKQ